MTASVSLNRSANRSSSLPVTVAPVGFCGKFKITILVLSEILVAKSSRSITKRSLTTLNVKGTGVAPQNSIIEIDCRPSDAIALAVRTESPIFAIDEVIEKAGVKMDINSDELKKETEISSPDNSFAPISEEEVKKLSAYSKFIETLNTDDIK